MKVFIFPTDDRSGQASVIYHYSKLGHEVYLPKHGTLGINWPRVSLWPALLYKCTDDLTKRNVDVHGFPQDGFFGEDHFITGDSGPLYDEDVSCRLIDLETENPGIDVFHTLRGAEQYLASYFSIGIKHFPNAKWVSSTFYPWSHNPGGFEPANAAKLIPANYEDSHLDRNNFKMLCCDFELKLLNVTPNQGTRQGFASFNHNFHVRQPDDFKLFTEMNDLLPPELKVKNYGGNIRAQGADTRYSLEKGVTGNWETLSPREAIFLMANLKGVVHFKQTDWGGGVFYHSLNTCRPVITTQRYVNASNAGKFLLHGFNALIVNTPNDAARAVEFLNDDTVADTMKNNMRLIKQAIFDETYWTHWQAFLENLQ